jgi:hypothetical protein
LFGSSLHWRVRGAPVGGINQKRANTPGAALGVMTATAGSDPVTDPSDPAGLGQDLHRLDGSPAHQPGTLFGDGSTAYPVVGLVVLGGQPGPARKLRRGGETGDVTDLGHKHAASPAGRRPAGPAAGSWSTASPGPLTARTAGSIVPRARQSECIDETFLRQVPARPTSKPACRIGLIWLCDRVIDV